MHYSRIHDTVIIILTIPFITYLPPGGTCSSEYSVHTMIPFGVDVRRRASKYLLYLVFCIALQLRFRLIIFKNIFWKKINTYSSVQYILLMLSKTVY